MKPLQLVIVGLWIVLVAITFYAVQTLGSAGGMVFIDDFAHPWRAQFNTDFSIHLLLLMIWVFWREQSKAIGLLAALGCLMGGLFTLPYLFVAIWRAKGDMRALLLGTHRVSA